MDEILLGEASIKIPMGREPRPDRANTFPPGRRPGLVAQRVFFGDTNVLKFGQYTFKTDDVCRRPFSSSIPKIRSPPAVANRP
jgi:hypothetical protein